MKKISKLLVIILLISITAIGCKTTKPIEDENNDPDIVEDEEKLEEERTMKAFLELIKAESKASDLGFYIRENIKYADENDADEMIHWLLIYQTEIINDLNFKISNSEYLDALNVNMNGILDETEIDSIENEKVRADYQELINGFMTIKRYEENPVVETYWKSLYDLSAYVSDDLGILLEVYKKDQNYEYSREELDVENIVKDTLRVESIIKDNKSSFINSLANKLYKLQISSLLIGPEGNYLGFFVDKNSKEYESLIKLKDDYLDSYYGMIVSELDRGDYENPMEVYDKIEEYLNFGIQSKNYIAPKEYKEGNIQYNSFEIKIPEDEEKQDRINNIIKDDLDQYFEDRVEEGQNYIISVYSNYGDNQYISYNGFLYIDYEGENPEEVNLYRTFDYKNEKYISLEEYLDTDFASLKEYIKLIEGIEISHNQNFQLNENGIDLYLQGVEGIDGYIQLSKKDLIEYLSLDELTKNY